MDSIEIKEGTKVYTPRFCTVRIEKVFASPDEAQAEGYREPTFYEHQEYDVLGKTLDAYHMVFAACRNTPLEDTG